MRETHVPAGRSARVVVAGGEGAGLREAWYLLHGYGQLAHGFMARFTGIATPDRVLVAPEALSRFYLRPGDDDPERAPRVGASWMTREDRLAEIDDYVRYLDGVVDQVERTGARVPERTVLGFSQGAHTAARWAVLGRTPVARLVLWGASLPPDLPAGAPSVLRNLGLVFVRGSIDPLRRRDEEAKDEAWLAEEGIPFRVREHDGAHAIDADLLEELAGGG